MYIAQVILVSMLCVITEQTIYDKSSQGVTNITVYPIQGDASITEVRFSYNLLIHIPSSYFRNLSNLNIINMRNNMISSIDDYSFTSVPSVTYIHLKMNHLSVIRRGMFSGLPVLQTVRLEKNRIHTVQPGCFKDNIALAYLQLGHNAIKVLPQSMFDLEIHPPALHLFHMENNPLVCNRSMCWVRQAELNGWIALGWPASCGAPAALQGRIWATLTTEELCCPPGQYLCLIALLTSYLYDFNSPWAIL